MFVKPFRTTIPSNTTDPSLEQPVYMLLRTCPFKGWSSIEKGFVLVSLSPGSALFQTGPAL